MSRETDRVALIITVTVCLLLVAVAVDLIVSGGDERVASIVVIGVIGAMLAWGLGRWIRQDE